MMPWGKTQAVVWLLGLCGLTSAHADGFRQAYEAALKNDPQIRAARHELAASLQAVPQAKANLLPNVSLGLSDAWVRGSRTSPDFLGRSSTSPLDFRSPQANITMRMPVFNREADARLRLAEAQASYAQAVYAARVAELVDRLGTAYLQYLFVGQTVALARSQSNHARLQLDLARQRLELGEGTRTEVADAEAASMMSNVQVREALDQQANAALAVAHLIGAVPSMVGVRLSDRMESWPSWPLEQWLSQAKESNPSVRARRAATEVTRLAIDRASAGHFPRLDLVASLSRASNESASTVNQTNRQSSIGLQFNLPLYAGGFVDSSIEQAVAERERAQAELESEELALTREIQRSYLTVTAASERIAALSRMVEAAAMTVTAAQRSMELGFGTRADVSQATRRYDEARRDLERARLEDRLARLRLMIRVTADPASVVGWFDAEGFVVNDPLPPKESSSP